MKSVIALCIYLHYFKLWETSAKPRLSFITCTYLGGLGGGSGGGGLGGGDGGGDGGGKGGGEGGSGGGGGLGGGDGGGEGGGEGGGLGSGGGGLGGGLLGKKTQTQESWYMSRTCIMQQVYLGSLIHQHNFQRIAKYCIPKCWCAMHRAASRHESDVTRINMCTLELPEK